jgi:hypothetical protein
MLTITVGRGQADYWFNSIKVQILLKTVVMLFENIIKALETDFLVDEPMEPSLRWLAGMLVWSGYVSMTVVVTVAHCTFDWNGLRP